MKSRFAICILALFQLFATVGCESGGGKSDSSAQNAALMSQLAGANASANVKCSEDPACVKQCQTNYQNNPSMMQICLNSTTSHQKLEGNEVASDDLVEICDANDVCALTPIDRIEACYQTGDCASTPAPKAKE